MRSPRRSLAIVLVLLALLLCLVLLRQQDSMASPVTSSGIAPASIQEPGEFLDIRRENAPVASGPIRMIDQLTGESLDLAVELVLDSDHSLWMHSGLIIHELTFGPDSLLRYDLVGTPDFEVPASGRIQFESGSWVLTIPYYARLRASVPPDLASEVDIHASIMIFRLVADPPQEPADFLSIQGARDGNTRETTFASLAKRSLRMAGGEPLCIIRCEEESIPPINLAASGDYVAGIILSDGSSAFEPITLVPGNESSVFLNLLLRPLLAGVLLDWHQQPVPDATVIFTTCMNNADYDLTPNDPHGLLGIRREGVVYECAKRGVKTDANGRFEMRVPRGTAYALESNALGSRAFWNSRDAGVVLSDGVEVRLQLEDPYLGRSVQLTVLRADGSPFSGAKCTVSIGSDIPFMRQWLPVELGQEGRCEFFGLKPGDTITVLAYHESLKSGLFASKYLVVPSSLQITMAVPPSAFLE